MANGTTAVRTYSKCLTDRKASDASPTTCQTLPFETMEAGILSKIVTIL